MKITNKQFLHYIPKSISLSTKQNLQTRIHNIILTKIDLNNFILGITKHAQTQSLIHVQNNFYNKINNGHGTRQTTNKQ